MDLVENANSDKIHKAYELLQGMKNATPQTKPVKVPPNSERDVKVPDDEIVKVPDLPFIPFVERRTTKTTLLRHKNVYAV